jgi:hypothetical protein
MLEFNALQLVEPPIVCAISPVFRFDSFDWVRASSQIFGTAITLPGNSPILWSRPFS